MLELALQKRELAPPPPHPHDGLPFHHQFKAGVLFCNRETKSLVTAIGTLGSMWMHAYILRSHGGIKSPIVTFISCK